MIILMEGLEVRCNLVNDTESIFSNIPKYGACSTVIFENEKRTFPVFLLMASFLQKPNYVSLKYLLHVNESPNLTRNNILGNFEVIRTLRPCFQLQTSFVLTCIITC